MAMKKATLRDMWKIQLSTCFMTALVGVTWTLLFVTAVAIVVWVVQRWRSTNKTMCPECQVPQITEQSVLRNHRRTVSHLVWHEEEIDEQGLVSNQPPGFYRHYGTEWCPGGGKAVVVES